jgi:subtilase family serine protease
VETNGRFAAHLTPAQAGLGAPDLVDAYKVDTSNPAGVTVALVEAFGYANAESDLASYRRQFGLPACTRANGCLKIVNQRGQTSPLPGAPPPRDDWTVETALDMDMVSAACPSCKILLVQADDDQGDGLLIGQATATQLGATIISDSWGGAEDPANPATDSEHFFDLPGVGIFVAAGDDGFDDGGQGPDYPGTSQHVTAVGGTSLNQSGGSRGWSETAWDISGGNGAGGSACSLSIPKPAWQTDTVCRFKATADVSAVGDPATGPAIFNRSNGGWLGIGGTSAAAPLVAGIYAQTGHAAESPSFAYAHASAYFDVTSGENGTCGNILCQAGRGWDGPTGMGTPNGAALAQVSGGGGAGGN